MTAPLHGLAEALAGAAVAGYAAATLVLTALGLHAAALALVRLVRPRRPLPRPAPGAPWPDVVVQLPVYDEPARLVARALDAALATDYPGRVEIQLLDDSPAPARRANAALCAERRGVRHLARGRRDGFKAGALAWGLAHTDAPVAAVFDVDFRPPPGLLQQLVGPLAADPGLAFVQARWHHEPAPGLLARAQAAVLDVHFAVEQAGRDRAGLPLVFNGSGGAWRVAAIEDAGGWSGATLAEDSDLALRAQARGWRARLDEGAAAPADLPPTVAAWRRQQARWAKGLAEVARERLGVLWCSGLPVRSRLAFTAHLALSLSLPALLVLVVLHPVVGAAQAGGLGLLNVGYLAMAGLVLAHTVALRALHPGRWPSEWVRIPAAMVAPVVLVVPAAVAVAQAVRGRRTAFQRTPKSGAPDPERGRAEVALAAYSVAGLAAIVAAGAWGAVPFQALLAVGTVGAAVAVRRLPPRPARDTDAPPLGVGDPAGETGARRPTPVPS